jgi:hypothetical protein
MFKLDINASEYIPSNNLLDEINKNDNESILKFEKNIMKINEWLIRYINEEYEKEIEKDQKNVNEEIEKDQKNENEEIEKDQKNENEEIEKDQKNENEEIEKKKNSKRGMEKGMRRRRFRRRQSKKTANECNVKNEKMKTLKTYAEVLKG